MVGSRLGVYEISDRLGAGAMGEVYRARDTRLGRDVAIKVLPAAFTSDADRLARFEREARLLASLSHPNIATVYGVEEAADVRAIAMELVEGEDVGARIARGPLPFREVLDVAAQIASALGAAHEGGVVHRDLKPANVVLTPEGVAKVLDFGLAKGVAPGTASGSGGSGASLTLTSAGTAAGMVLGTAAYMSPEQARGKPVDRRTDVWAFGCVVYEMLTGAPAFPGETVTDVLAAIVHEEPDWSRLPDGARPRLERLLRRCLAKDVRNRASDLGDVALVLREIASEKDGAGSVVATTPAGTTPRRRSTWPVVAVAVLGLAAGAAIGARWLGARSGADASPGGLVPVSFRQLTMAPGGEGQPSVSPDGGSFVYVAGPDGNADIFLQRVDGRNAVNLTEGCPSDDVEPAFSPDGARIAYRSECGGGGMFVMGASGESPRKVSDFGWGPAWSPDGDEIAVVTERVYLPWGRSTTSTLWAVDVETGERRLVSEHDAAEPSWSPDGRRIAFWGLDPAAQRDLYTVAADGSESAADAAVRVTDDSAVDWSAIWSADGRQLYFSSTRGGTVNLWRVAVDRATGRATGDPVAMTLPSSWIGWTSLSADGRRLVFVDRNARTSIRRAPFDARRGELAGPPEAVPLGTFELHEAIDLSPDGSTIVFASSGLPQHLFLVRADGSRLVQLTDGPHRDRQPAFSPDGRRIAFQTNRWPSSMAMIDADGSGLRELASDRSDGWHPVWSPDGARVAVSAREGAYLLDPDASAPDAATAPIADGATEPQFWPSSFSPDGRRLLGGLWESGMPVGIALRSLDDGSERTIRPGPGIAQAQFLPDGRRAVIGMGNRLVLHDLDTGASRDLVSAPAAHGIAWFALSRDGRWIAWLDTADESDIWMATLGAAGSAAE